MKLSFIIVTYHRREALQACIDSCIQQRGLETPFEIIVIDNGGDASVNPLPADVATLKLERTPNLGVAGGRNRGISLASGDFLFFIDDDATWHDNGVVRRMLDIIEARPDVAAVAVNVIDPDTHQFVKHYFPHPDKTYIAAATDPIEVPYYYGGGHVLRAEAVQKVGGYPERFFYSMEEIDLCLRLVDAGYKIMYDPRATIYHHEGKRERGNRDVNYWQGVNFWKRSVMNKIRVAWRNLPYPYPITVFLVWSAALLFKTRRPAAMLQVWRDLWDERVELAHERQPVRARTVQYLRHIGARLVY